MSDSKKKYLEFSEAHYLPIFNKPFWLDAVCGENNWEVAYYGNDAGIAFLPYFIKKNIFKIVTLPKLTQKIQIVFKKNENNQHFNENFFVENLLQQISPYALIRFSISENLINSQPFYWQGYEINPLFSFIIKDIKSIESVINNFNTNRKRNVKKANTIVQVKENIEIDVFYKFKEECLNLEGSKISYSIDLLRRIYDACKKNDCIKIFHAVDNLDNIHAALLVIWDKESAYHLIPAVNQKFLSSGAMSLLVVKAIMFLQGKTIKYDFEGGMSKNLENAYKSYGSEQYTYTLVTKYKSKFFKLLFALKSK